MQRLTLILSDLYLPEGNAGGDAPRTHELPALNELLRLASGPESIGDWRDWLLREIGGQLPEIPLAKLCAAGRVNDTEIETAWLATPVALEARLDHVRMKDRGLIHIDERAAWCAQFNRVFGPQYSLHDGGERAFILTGLRATTRTTDPARLLGAEIGPALPGADAPELRRLWAEIEMWLHGCALNDARERARKPRVSALWLWGRNAGSRDAHGVGGQHLELHGGDPLIDGLRRARLLPPRAAPPAFAPLEAGGHGVVEFAVVTGRSEEALAELDSNWFAAARHALASGELSLLEIIANDRCFRITPRAHWRFWRPRRAWLENLARPAG